MKYPSSHFGPVLLASALIGIGSLPLVAQDGGGRASLEKPLEHPGHWEPASISSPYGKAWGLSATEIKTISGEMTAIADLITESCPVLRAPVGFQAKVYQAVGGTTGAPREARQQFPTSHLSLYLFKYLRECPTCEIEPEVEASGKIVIAFNEMDALFPLRQKPFAVDEAGPIYVGPAAQGRLAGFPVFQSPGKGPKFVLTNHASGPGERFWLPVSQERYIRAEIAAAQKVQQAAAGHGRTNSYQERRLSRLEEELNGLSAAERAADAYVGGHSSRPSGLISPTDSKAQALVGPNPQFYDRRLPLTSLQIAVIETSPAIPNTATFMGRTLKTILDSVDWQAVGAELGRTGIIVEKKHQMRFP